MKIGLYFGSFNPIHNGHLIIANYVCNFTELEKIWLVVSPQNPFKESKSLLNEYNRLHLLRTAIQDDNRFRATDIEFGLPKPSYTVNTLTYLKEKFPEHNFSLIMGSDSYQNLPKWKNSEIIIENYPLYIYLRPGYEIATTTPSVTILKAPLLEISSTEIRHFIKTGKSIRYLVPENVRDEIEKGGYYKK